MKSDEQDIKSDEEEQHVERKQAELEMRMVRMYVHGSRN